MQVELDDSTLPEWEQQMSDWRKKSKGTEDLSGVGDTGSRAMGTHRA
jgi:hypothetical protein